MTKPWEQQPPGRQPAQTKDRQRVLIVCEDSKSACDYFKSFKVDPKRAEVLAVGAGMNTDSLVEFAISLKEKAAQKGQTYNQVWCVFDRDSFLLANYVRAFDLAYASGIKVAWANEAFELWYLLHFNYHDTGISRHDYKLKLRPNIEYDKADPTVYDKLKAYQETALKFARKLERYWNDMGEKFPERQNPSTSIHKLVGFLNELADLGDAD